MISGAFCSRPAAGPPAAFGHSPNLRGGDRAGLCPADQLAAHGVRARVGALVRVVRQPGRRLWDRGPRDDGHHNEPVGGRSPPPVALEAAGDGDRIGFFLVVDVAFFAANAVKIPQGGWFPLLIGAAVFTLMSTWRRGGQIILERTSGAEVAIGAQSRRGTDAEIGRAREGGGRSGIPHAQEVRRRMVAAVECIGRQGDGRKQRGGEEE